MRFKNTFFILVGALAGCAPLSPVVRLDPAIEKVPASVSNRPPLYLNVKDEREKKRLGTLPDGTSVTAAVPLEDIVRLQLSEGLTRAGFVLAALGDSSIPTLAVDITKLNYTIERGATWSEIRVLGELRAIAINDTTKRTKTYKVENGKKWGLSPPSRGHERYLNTALSELIETLLTDESLLTFLAKGD